MNSNTQPTVSVVYEKFCVHINPYSKITVLAETHCACAVTVGIAQAHPTVPWILSSSVSSSIHLLQPTTTVDCDAHTCISLPSTQ